MEVRNVEELAAAVFEPRLPGACPAAGTMAIAAGVPEDVLEAAGVTAVAMTAEGGRAAVGNGAHGCALGSGGVVSG